MSGHGSDRFYPGGKRAKIRTDERPSFIGALIPSPAAALGVERHNARQRARDLAFLPTAKPDAPTARRLSTEEIHEYWRAGNYDAVESDIERVINRVLKRRTRNLNLTSEHREDCKQACREGATRAWNTWSGGGELMGYVAEQVRFALSKHFESAATRLGQGGMTGVPAELLSHDGTFELDAPKYAADGYTGEDSDGGATWLDDLTYDDVEHFEDPGRLIEFRNAPTQRQQLQQAIRAIPDSNCRRLMQCLFRHHYDFLHPKRSAHLLAKFARDEFPAHSRPNMRTVRTWYAGGLAALRPMVRRERHILYGGEQATFEHEYVFSIPKRRR